MTLDLEQIKKIILTNPNKELVAKAKTYSQDLRSHFYGERLEAKLPVIDGFEKELLQKLRVKYAKSNKDIFSRLSRPIDKVFSARGGSVYFNLSEQLEKKASNLRSNIRDGYSVKKWLESFWKPHFLDDPNGMIFLEIDADQNAYPTYKGIASVFDYDPKGVNLEYIVFTVSASEKKKASIDPSYEVYRVVDDSFDYYVRKEGENVTVLQEHTFPNYFFRVPAILNSDIVNPILNGSMLSLFDEVIDLANLFLIKGSIKVTHDFMHAFPKYWEYADDCSICNGTGLLNAENCSTCKGTGKRVMSKISDVKLMSYPESKDSPIVTPNVAGYVEPSKTYYEIATADLQALEDAMTFTLWGTHRKQNNSINKDSSQPKTATEAFIDIQPVNDRLYSISESAEKRDKFITDLTVGLMIQIGYKGSTINYGRRYMMENPDAIWDRYSKARKSGAPMKVLNDLLVEYIESKYNGDPVSMSVQLKLINVEPFVHNTINEVKGFGTSFEDLCCKIYFGEWLSTINNGVILSYSSIELLSKLKEYVTAKGLKEPIPENAPTKIGFLN
jgi:hypothetical protein